jgi:glycosidase
MKSIYYSIFALGLLFSCTPKTEEVTEVKTEKPVFKPVETVAWAKNASVYELNIRQYSKEGNFKAIIQDLPRIKSLGVKIIWLMPIHPIGEKNRKGGKGSYYSVKDYKGINPEYGTEADFKTLVEEIHKLDMKVIIDWVANHTSWDHVWTKNKEWYTLDSTGNFQPPVPDWTDVIDLNFDNRDMRNAMIDAMQYWVKNFDIDGFRCDVAMMVPTDFWNEARYALDTVKPIFMLAEAEQADLHEFAFDMNYGWELLHIMNGIAKGEKQLSAIDEYLAKNDTAFSKTTKRMYFTDNHDENSWNGTVFERYKENHLVFATLAYTIGGTPLLYSGQEAGVNRALAFFEKDSIDWSNTTFVDFYTRLLKLYERNEALWDIADKSNFTKIETNDKEVYAFSRIKGAKEVIVALNFSKKPKKLSLNGNGEYISVLDDKKFDTKALQSINLLPNNALILEK